MFIDQVVITVKAGKGGDGSMHFRRKKYLPKGGPDGGDGGNGGNVVLCAQNNLNTLAKFRHRKVFTASAGTAGQKDDQHGKNGEDLILPVPVGTMVTVNRLMHHHTLSTAKIPMVLADLTTSDQKITIAHGGRGGKGNAGFVSATRQAPRFAELGDIGEELEITLELKLIADVALVGMPSAGKSTFISVVSNCRPKIADYPFTTLVPNLGVCRVDDKEFVIVDVPGLIEGASEGRGLGHKFLRHIERSRFILQIIDGNSTDHWQEYHTVRKELEKFSPILAKKPYLVVIAKQDVISTKMESQLTALWQKKGVSAPYFISSVTHQGVQELLQQVIRQLAELRTEKITPKTKHEEDKVVIFRPGLAVSQNDKHVSLTLEKSGLRLHNPRLERLARQTDWGNTEAVQRFWSVLQNWGVDAQWHRTKTKNTDYLLISNEKLHCPW